MLVRGVVVEGFAFLRWALSGLEIINGEELRNGRDGLVSADHNSVQFTDKFLAFPQNEGPPTTTSTATNEEKMPARVHSDEK